MSEKRKYGVLLTTAKAIQFTLFAGVDIEPAATFEVGDIKISKDGGAEVNTTNLPVDEGQGYSLILTAVELTAARIRLFIVDQTATKVWLDIDINIETYGHAFALHAFDLNDNVRPDLNAIAIALTIMAGADGVRLATLQANYAPALASVATEARLVELDAANIPADIDTLLTRIVGTLAAGTHNPATAAQIAVLSDWINGGRLDLILDARASQATSDAIETDTQNIQSRIPTALIGGKMNSDAAAVGGSTDGATRLGKATQANVYGTIGSGSTTTSLVTSALDPAAAAIDQFKGKVVTFDANTTTVNLRGQSTDITANTAGGVLTVTALTTAAVSGDTFVIT